MNLKPENELRLTTPIMINNHNTNLVFLFIGFSFQFKSGSATG